MTLPETLMAVFLLATFCGSIFELNAVCLRYIDATKESIAALESVHDRCEMLQKPGFHGLDQLKLCPIAAGSARQQFGFLQKGNRDRKDQCLSDSERRNTVHQKRRTDG